MLSAIASVRSRLLAIFILMAGSGFMATLLSLRLERAGQSTIIKGLVATVYFAGLVIGALRSGRIVRRVGHIRAFAAFVALLSASTLGYAQFTDQALWREKATPPVPAPKQQDFQILPRTTPIASLLDPNMPDSPAAEESQP
jgi:MFS family permease